MGDQREAGGGPIRTLTVFGTRPEAIKLFPVIQALDADARFTSRVCVSGQHRGMLDQVLAMAGIVPHHDLGLMQPGQSLDALLAALIVGIGEVLDAERPDWVLVQGDTATALAGAIAAHHRRIRIAHVEAGLRSGDPHDPWPEEGYRRAIGTLAALHLAPTEGAAQALRRENVDAALIRVTGNTVIDALHRVLGRVAREPGLAAAMEDLAERHAGKRIVAVTTHRRENIGGPMEGIAEAVARLARRGDVAIVLPMHRNPQVRAILERRLRGLPAVALVEPLDYPDFARLMELSTLILTDSGGVQEEAPALGKPVLVLRETTERPEGLAAGTARLVGTCSDRIVAETERLLDDAAAYAAMSRAHNPFGDGKAAGRIVEELARRC